MSKEVNKVFRTKDYSIFKFHKENRTIENPKVNALILSMKQDGWVTGSNVIVDGKYQIIDGQHRVLAAMETNVPVDYIMVKSANGETIRKLNTKGSDWRIIQHLDYHVKRGNQNYVLLDRFMKNFPALRPTECMMLIKNSLSSTKRGSFEDGEFVVKDMKIAYKWGHDIMSLKPLFPDGYNKSIFVRAMIKAYLHPKFVFDEFRHKVELRRSMIHMCGTVDQYVEMIEKIYNFRRPADDKINLRF
jgi:hypothetical protein